MINIFYKIKYMETLIKRSFFLLMATLAITTTLHAQTADDIVNKYITALGGRTVITGVKSLKVESTVDVMGQSAPSTTYILAGKGFKSETDFGGQKMVQCINTSGGWMINPMDPTGGGTKPTPIPADQAKASMSQLEIGGPLVDYAAHGDKVELVGKDSADYKLKLTTSAGVITYYINMKTYLVDKQINKTTANGQEVETTISFSDYRKTDFGYTIAYAQTLDLPPVQGQQISLNITHQKITVNPSIDPTIFDMPK
jgi:hypothetical protein